MDKFLAVQTLIIILLLVVSVVAIAVRHLRVPYRVALVIVWLLVTYQHSLYFNKLRNPHSGKKS